MTRNKKQSKPLFGLKGDFSDLLDNVCQQAIMLLQAVDFTLEHSDELPKAIKDVLQERHDAMRAVLMSDDT